MAAQGLNDGAKLANEDHCNGKSEVGEGGSRTTCRRPYQRPVVAKKRTVSRATLFSGTGPDSGGVVSA